MTRLISLATLAPLLVLASGPALAQDAIVEGDGYPIGEGAVLHTTVGVEGGVDSNVFYLDADPIAAPVLRTEVSAAIASEGNKRKGDKGDLPGAGDPTTSITGSDLRTEEVHPDWDFRLALRLGYDRYIGVGHADRPFDIDYSISQQSNLNGDLDIHVERTPKGQTSYFFDDDLVRDTRPRNFLSAGNLNRWHNQLAAGAHYRPGRGALDFSLRYENTIDRFDPTDDGGPGVQLANRMNHLARARAEWQFLPITRFFFDSSFGFFGPLGTSQKAASTPLRLQIGTSTLITEATTIRAHIGFGKGFYSAGPDFMMALYGVEFGLRYSPFGRFTIGFEYDFKDSINSNFYRDYALVGKVDHQIRQYLINLGAQARLRGYRGVFMSVGPPNRDDLIIAANAKVHYLTRDWLAFTALLDLAIDSTSYVDNLGDNPSYVRAELTVGATAAF